MRATIRHTLSARFVEIDEPDVEEFERDGVLVRVDARVRESQSFATIVCSGSVEIDRVDALQDTSEYLPFLSRAGRLDEHEREVRYAWSRIEPVLQYVGGVLRWRFGMFGDHPLWTSTDVLLEVHGTFVELTPMTPAVMGDDMARIAPNGLSHVTELVSGSAMPPLAHEMWREGWNLRHSSPRSSLVVGVAAAEVGFKQLVSLLVPAATAMVEYIPSPPLDTMIRKVLPDLPIRSGLDPRHACPQHIRKRLIEAGEARNLVVHRGRMPSLDLRSTLLDTRDFLYLLDCHAGHPWAQALLSQRTRDALHLSR